MKKPYMIIAVIVILFLAGGYFMMKKSPTSSMKTEDPKSMDSTMDSISGTIEDLIAKNVPMECTYTSVVSGQESTGTVMVAGNKMKGQFTTMVDGKEQTVRMIQDGEYMYSWSDLDKNGMKVKIDSMKDEVEKAKAEMTKDNSLAFAQQQADYSCKPWIVAPSTFTPPSDVTFTDLSAMMESSQKMMDKAPAAPCSVCDQVPAGESRDACKAQLKC